MKCYHTAGCSCFDGPPVRCPKCWLPLCSHTEVACLKAQLDLSEKDIKSYMTRALDAEKNAEYLGNLLRETSEKLAKSRVDEARQGLRAGELEKLVRDMNNLITGYVKRNP